MNQIEQLIAQVFMSTDARNWEALKACFTNPFILDYESMSEQSPAQLTPDQLVIAWGGLMPGFDSTHHQIGNIVITKTPNGFHAFCYGTATHYIQDVTPQTWCVYGTYDFDIRSEDNSLKIERMTFNYKFQSGNSELSKFAIERVNQ